jgi:Tol biopolymer transport system component
VSARPTKQGTRLGRLVVVLGVAVTVAIPLALGATSSVARAAFPGANGKIVFETDRDGNSEIYTMNADGTNRVNLTRNAEAQDVTPRWSADGRRIVFVSNRDGNDEIFSMNEDGSNVVQVTHTENVDNRRPGWTGDGGILFQRVAPPNPRDVVLINADGTKIELTPDSVDSAFAAAAPKGPWIVMSRINASPGEGQRLYTMNTISRVMKLVTRASPEFSDTQANWSPSGNDLVFVRRGDPGTEELFVVHKDGTGLRQLTDTPGRVEDKPAFSPDGTKIVFSACAAEPARHCANYVTNADGSGGEVEVTTPTVPYIDTFSGGYLDPFWHDRTSGDGSSLAQVNGHLEETFSSDAGDPPDFNLNAHIGTQCTVGGDFDVQADFALLTWPTSPSYAGVEVALSTFGPDARTVRESQFWAEQYSSFIPPTVTSGPATTDTSGTLRLTRSGSTITSWNRTETGWNPIASGETALVNATVALELSSYSNRFMHAEVKVAWDNFRINTGTVSCPIWWTDSSPDWQPSSR